MRTTTETCGPPLSHYLLEARVGRWPRSTLRRKACESGCRTAISIVTAVLEAYPRCRATAYTAPDGAQAGVSTAPNTRPSTMHYSRQSQRRFGGKCPKGMTVLRFRQSLKNRYLLTGESPRQLRRDRAGNQSSPHARIPSAVGDQALLESWVMRRLQWAPLGDETYPLGARRIRIPEHGTPVIHLDDRSTIGQETAQRVCEVLLPISGPDGPIEHGVPALRVRSVAGRDLTIGLMGTSAALTIRAAVPWAAVLSLWQQELELDGFRPRWDSACPVEYEDTFIDIHASWAELGSAMLRRLAIFQQGGVPYGVDGWINPGTWILELTTDHVSSCSPDLKVRHDKFLALLCDEHLGLALRIDSESCICDKPFGFGAACIYYLVPRHGRSRQQLQLRFRWVPGHRDFLKDLRAASKDRR